MPRERLRHLAATAMVHLRAPTILLGSPRSAARRSQCHHQAILRGPASSFDWQASLSPDATRIACSSGLWRGSSPGKRDCTHEFRQVFVEGNGFKTRSRLQRHLAFETSLASLLRLQVKDFAAPLYTTQLKRLGKRSRRRGAPSARGQPRRQPSEGTPCTR